MLTLHNFYKNEYMNIKSTIIFASLLCISALSSCIQDEAPNAEADILTCTVPDLDPMYLYGSETIEVSKNSNEVNILVFLSKMPSEIQLSPTFTTTEGATITPTSGSTLTFSKNNGYKQTYTVTSQSGKYFRNYTVQLKEANVFKVNGDSRIFSFEYSSIFKEPTNAQYQKIYDVFEGEKDTIWESANAGFAITNKKASIDAYPTTHVDNGKGGKCVCLRTSLVGALGKMVNMPMAAGNFFIGSFDKSNAMKSALTSTKFGILTYRNPLSFNFSYKFKRGDKFTNEKLEVLSELDYPDAYAVLYRPFDKDGKRDSTIVNPILLDGTSVLPEKSGARGNIVACAKWNNKDIVNEDNLETAEFHHVSIPFKFVAPYSEINHKELKDGQYYLTVVFTSSYKGDYFYGAEGSTLYIDEATITFEPENE